MGMTDYQMTQWHIDQEFREHTAAQLARHRSSTGRYCEECGILCSDGILELVNEQMICTECRKQENQNENN